ncbi:hypothetical protein QAD02_023515 [Eretmocerus hayati]|uniref:Uncharacterized protein n=1 Tax=Eretmocerus hayati TaxID=131215 RepID=A0ACC2PXQ8_9HYME|nr:hypothetical protein QAD02_023515 [Eretmocerus hayati]
MEGSVSRAGSGAAGVHNSSGVPPHPPLQAHQPNLTSQNMNNGSGSNNVTGTSGGNAGSGGGAVIAGNTITSNAMNEKSYILDSRKPFEDVSSSHSVNGYTRANASFAPLTILHTSGNCVTGAMS